MEQKPKILFLQTAHFASDERVFYLQRPALIKAGYEVKIVSSLIGGESVPESWTIDGAQFKPNQKAKILAKQVAQWAPQQVICDSPLAVYAAHKAKVQGLKIVYDVTEWYPARKHLERFKGLRKVGVAIKMMGYSFVAGCWADRFLFGEKAKGRAFRVLFPFKKYSYLPYYPDLSQLPLTPPLPLQDPIRLFYSGPATEPKGFQNVLRAAQECAKSNGEHEFVLHLILTGSTQAEGEQQIATLAPLPNLRLEVEGSLPFATFCQRLQTPHFCLDLRAQDWENRHCVPIKIFYYMAMGKAVVYSDLPILRSLLGKGEKYGLWADPTDAKAIANYVKQCLQKPENYLQQATQAQQAAQKTYNWAVLEPVFIDFIQKA